MNDRRRKVVACRRCEVAARNRSLIGDRRSGETSRNRGVEHDRRAFTCRERKARARAVDRNQFASHCRQRSRWHDAGFASTVDDHSLGWNRWAGLSRPLLSNGF